MAVDQFSPQTLESFNAGAPGLGSRREAVTALIKGPSALLRGGMLDSSPMTSFADLCADLEKQLDALYVTLRAPDTPPGPLFHYTTAEGILGITQNHTLRASNCRYLNDVSEPAYAQSVVKEAVTNLAHTVTPGSSQSTYSASSGPGRSIGSMP